MNIAFALTVVLAAQDASAGVSEAILAFDDGGAEAVRYYARKGATRRALPGEPEQLAVDGVGGTPSVTAILVGFPGAPALDSGEVDARLFAFGDTVNARLRQVTGGKRGITGKVLGPVTVAAPASCDLNTLFSAAARAAKADLAGTDVALIVAPRFACRFSGASTLGRVADGKRKYAVAWAFGEGWVAAAAHALEHAMGTRHPAQPASDDFGWAPAPASAPKGPRVAKRKQKEPKGGELLTLASVAHLIDTPERAPQGLRDAPAAVRPSLGIGLRASPGASAGGVMDDLRLRRAAPGAQAPKFRGFDAASCREAARSLRDAAKAAAGASRASAKIARRRLATVVEAQQAAFAKREVPTDVEVSLLTTNAETELNVALIRLQDPKTTAKTVKEEVIPAVERAAEELEQAGRRLSRG